MKKLIIVESPTKAKTIKKFLGREYTVLACMGHVRDLPDKASEIPAQYKKFKWARLGVNIEDKFKPLYVVSGRKTKTLSELRKALADADSLLLATDEDREGESISWHLLEVLKPKIPTKRMVFHEITKPAIQNALENPRDIDMQLVHAQEARRILDRLVGYTISPLIWKKIAYGLSAGRVQSVALKSLVDLEKERMKFVSAKYWGVLADLSKDGKDKNVFEAKLTQVDGKKIATGKDFDETTGKLKAKVDAILLSRTQAEQVIAGAKSGTWRVRSVEEKPVNRKPAPPFITSTLQQEANRKLGLSARETMRIAQSLYERGFITYMRTDSTNLSESAIKSSRAQVERLYGKDHVSPEPRRYTKKAKGAQEAHEAIRPSLDFTPPQEMGLRGREYDVYEMIWMRTIATQMAESRQLQVSANLVVDTPEGTATFHSSGMKILFPGFLMAYVEGEDDPEVALAKKERFLPDFKEGDVVKHMKSAVTEHETKPPARFTEASLIQFLEKEGIGRPSTYASIVSTVLDRGYAVKTGNALVPTFTGFAVTGLMDRHFQEFVDKQFTSNMEEKLDEIAEGKLDYLPYLSNFYLGDSGLQHKVEVEDKKIDPERARELNFSHIENLHVYVGKYGPYFEYIDPKTQEKTKASIPNTVSPSDLNEDSIHSIVEQVKKGDQALATDPETGKPIYLKTGQYGPYLQLGDISDDPKEKLKRVSVPKGVDPNNIDEKTAIKIIGLPRLLGKHPQTGKDIRASVGRFGPYIVHDGDFRSLKKDDSVLDVDLDRALELLSQEKKGRRRGSQALKELGKHPDGEKVELMQGPYGIYVKHGKVNATVPKEKEPDEVTLELALQLLAAKSADGGGAKTKSAAKRAPKRGARRSKTSARS